MDYKNTLNLPSTSFQMKANLPQREPDFVKFWKDNKIYEKALQLKEKNKKYILHDGPPYANGHIHIGHALNKILKDIIVKHKLLEGYHSPFVPGWDCHGLPIELQVTKSLGPKAKETSPTEIRKLSREYAQKYINIQREEFIRLGVFGLWDKPYLTMSKEYEFNIAKLLVELYDKGVIYKGQKPIHWCFDCKTALAEAEIEYYEKISPSIYVKFPVKNNDIVNGNLFVLIWTTTPWTLPGNTAVAFSEELDYVVASFDNKEFYILSKALLDEVGDKVGNNLNFVKDISIQDIKKLVVWHPFENRESKIVFGEHVSADTGTGIVHTAPGHGTEDYEVGVKYNLQVLSPVDDDGKFTDEVIKWKGLQVFEANKHIIQYLKETGMLLHTEEYKHQYPHCWRCKNPVIFRTKPQWFFNVNEKTLKESAIKGINNVKWIPSWGKNRIEAMVRNRTDWCLSRQRAWGVPIPAITCKKCGKTHLGGYWGKHILSIFEKEGVDIWFEKPTEELTKDFKCDCGSSEFDKEMDIVDVWFDSGVSSFCVLDTREELSSPADLYLEGSDQHRGWFQSSLWPSVAIRGIPPYRNVLTHGFVLDETGRAMHKSLGNVVSPEEVIKKYGADVLRLWVVSEDYTEDLRIGDHILEKVVDAYRKVRNTFRYMLANLYDFSTNDIIPYQKLTSIDKWILDKLYNLSKEIKHHYDNFEFNKVYRKIYDFCNVDLSATYFDILKDRLYTGKKDGLKRRSSQTTIYYILSYLVKAVAPILSFTAEDIWQNFFKDRASEISVFLTEYDKIPEEWNNPQIRDKFNMIMEVREVTLKALETARREGLINSSLESKLIINTTKKEIESVLNENKDDLWEFFIVSQVELSSSNCSNLGYEENGIIVSVVKAEGQKCERCWIYSPTVGKNPEHLTICSKCIEAISSVESQKI
ncbi:MAG: isoleucine--tRNA ligase [Brevinematales bacterium]|nr:isoleucine--tRNA ligase [Brevinematales bacterium]